MLLPAPGDQLRAGFECCPGQAGDQVQGSSSMIERPTLLPLQVDIFRSPPARDLFSPWPSLFCPLLTAFPSFLRRG